MHSFKRGPSRKETYSPHSQRVCLAILKLLPGQQQVPHHRHLCWNLSASNRHVAFANKRPSSQESTIKSLESILGSRDGQGEDERPEDDEKQRSYAARGAAGAVGAPGQRNRKAPDATARRVRPLYVYVIYYCFIVVYLAKAWLQATEGDVAASTLADGLVNDHLAVAAGQVPRLATAGFVCEGPLELFLQLATLLTVGVEAEALLGYSLFWAVYWLANLGGGLADAAFSELPVTYGPANAAAGMVGALAAFYARNLGLEQRIEAARRVARRRRRRQMLDGLGGGGAGRDTALPGRRGPGSAAEVEDPEEVEAEVEVEVLPLLPFTLTSRMSSEARALLNVFVALVVASQGLLDLGGASSSASWIGLIAAFWTGLVLTFGAGPQYEVCFAPLDVAQEGGSSSSGGHHGSSSSGSDSSTSNTSSGGCSSSSSPSGPGDPLSSPSFGTRHSTHFWPMADQARGRPSPDDDGLTVVDVCPPSRRQAVLGAYTAGMAALMCGWLAWMGADI